MAKFLQFIALFSELGCACCIIYVLVMATVYFFRQIYIRMRCSYRGSKGKPGRICVICKYHGECERAYGSMEYAQYFLDCRSNPVKAQKLFDEIQAEEEDKLK